MVKIRFRKPGDGEFAMDLEMPAAPRVDEVVNLKPGGDSRVLRVHSVTWYPQEYDFDAYVILR